MKIIPQRLNSILKRVGRTLMRLRPTRLITTAIVAMIGGLIALVGVAMISIEWALILGGGLTTTAALLLFDVRSP